MERIEDQALCALCGGLCCQRAPGRFSPDDFMEGDEPLSPAVRAALDDGFAAVYTSFVTVGSKKIAPLFTVASRGVRKPVLSLCDSESWCVRLTMDGCTLPLEERPFECAMMVPNRNISLCALPGGMTMEQLWIPYQNILRALIEQYAGRPWFQELSAQIQDPEKSDPYTAGVRELTDAIGLAFHERELDEIARCWLAENS
jgi:hypothetical protein